MKTRTLVDRQWIRIKSGAPRAQAVHRDVVCRAVFSGRQTAPVQRLDMHGPECLDGLVALVPGHRLTRPLASFASFLPHSSSELSALSQRPNVLLFRMTPTAFGAADTASPQCVGVNRPEGTKRFVLEPRLHRITSARPRRSTTWYAMASKNSVRDPDAYHAQLRGQDKSREVRPVGWLKNVRNISV